MNDHRKLGRELGLFDTDPLMGAGLPYRSREHSYRELPLRIAEIGSQFRAELSGVLGGLTRVRAMRLNDVHIFCALEQVGAEVGAALGMIQRAYEVLGIRPVRYRLSLPGGGSTGEGNGASGNGAKYVADPDMWERAGSLLASVLDETGLAYEKAEGEAAFYGPKIDVQVADPAGRESSLSTIQTDFFQPERFGLRYTASDGSKRRPVMVHRSIIGSAERAVAHLIEAHGGAFQGSRRGPGVPPAA